MDCLVNVLSTMTVLLLESKLILTSAFSAIPSGRSGGLQTVSFSLSLSLSLSDTHSLFSAILFEAFILSSSSHPSVRPSARPAPAPALRPQESRLKIKARLAPKFRLRRCLPLPSPPSSLARPFNSRRCRRRRRRIFCVLSVVVCRTRRVVPFPRPCFSAIGRPPGLS